MNWLAHLYFADDTPHSLIGNLAGDFGRGVDVEALHPLVRRGLDRHRSIDRFTDAHPMHRSSRARFAPVLRHYAAVLVDIVYDHYLACSWERWSDMPLEDFAERVHDTLAEHPELLSPELAEAAPRLERRGWLLSYREDEGLERVLRALSTRSSRRPDLVRGIEVLKEQREEIGAEFDEFFPELVSHVSTLGSRPAPWRS